MKLKAVVDILQGRLIKRGISLKALDYRGGAAAQKGTVRQEIPSCRGWTRTWRARWSRTSSPEAQGQAAMQTSRCGFSSKSKDEPAAGDHLPEGKEYKRPLQFANYR